MRAAAIRSYREAPVQAGTASIMDWRDLAPCYQGLPDPLFGIEIAGSKIPVIAIPEEILSAPLQGKRVRVCALLGFMTPTGNSKWIPARHMIQSGIKNGLLRRGQKLVEPTSGNMGLSLAYCAAEHDIEVYAIVSDNLPEGKRLPLRRYGARVVTESEAASFLGLARSPGSIELARLYAHKIDGVFMNQYANPLNPESYRMTVAPALWKGVGSASLFVSAVGSTGTLVGLGGYFKKMNPGLRVVATMPYLGQSIDGTRDQGRLKEVSHDWRHLTDIIEPIDERTARTVSDLLNRNRLPAGPSSGASFGTAEHYLLDRLEAGGFEEMRGEDGMINVLVVFSDTSYPYEKVPRFS